MRLWLLWPNNICLCAEQSHTKSASRNVYTYIVFSLYVPKCNILCWHVFFNDVVLPTQCCACCHLFRACSSLLLSLPFPATSTTEMMYLNSISTRFTCTT